MFPTKSAHETPRCCVCFASVPLGLDFGRCAVCRRGMAASYKTKLQAMSRAERQQEYTTTAKHDRPPWTWEGNEGALIAEDEQRTREEVAEAEPIAQSEKQNG
jgi:hypothetical protein